jgi:CBS domain-containing protein
VREKVTGEQQMTWTVSDVMTKDADAIGQAAELVAAAVVATSPSTSLADAASLMFQHRIPVLPVVDTQKQPAGIVSRTQLLKVFLRSDEAIRREVVRLFHDVASVTGNQVEVTAGLVRLHGESEEDLPKTLLKRIAGVPGVVGVKIDLVGELSERRSGPSGDPAPA